MHSRMPLNTKLRVILMLSYSTQRLNAWRADRWSAPCRRAVPHTKTWASSQLSMAWGELCTWWPVPVENMNIHKILQIVLQRFPSLPSPSICALDAFGLPVCPVDSLAIKSKSKGVRQIAPNQHLVRLPPAPRKNITKKSLRGRGFPCPLSTPYCTVTAKGEWYGDLSPQNEVPSHTVCNGKGALLSQWMQLSMSWFGHFTFNWKERQRPSALCALGFTPQAPRLSPQRRLPYLPVASIQTGILDGLHACICPVQALWLIVNGQAIWPCQVGGNDHQAVWGIHTSTLNFWAGSPVGPVHEPEHKPRHKWMPTLLHCHYGQAVLQTREPGAFRP